VPSNFTAVHLLSTPFHRQTSEGCQKGGLEGREADMQVRSQQGSTRTREPAPITTEPNAIAVTGRRRIGLRTITAVVVAATLLTVATMVVSSRGGSVPRTTQPTTAALTEVSRGNDIDSPRLRTALDWVEGLATGLILPTDVSDRLTAQKPRMARIVTAAWSDLNAVST
jgi:hypothetical protein